MPDLELREFYDRTGATGQLPWSCSGVTPKQRLEADRLHGTGVGLPEQGGAKGRAAQAWPV
ncbi:hypothetical protein GCM10019017_23800 [Streptomyces showdoensis]